MMRERGLTLIEVIVAMFIVLVMMTFLIPIYLRTMKVKSRTEEIAALTARGRGAMGVLRRDLGGAFRTAVSMYELGTHSLGSEFHWEAPVDTTAPVDPSMGFRRLTFVGAVDGSRVSATPAEYPLRPFDYERVSWAVRGGVIFRQVFSKEIAITSSNMPAGWCFSPPDVGGEGVKIGVQVMDTGDVFGDVGTYRRSPYIYTQEATSVPGFALKRGTDSVETTVTLCFPAGQSIPDWAENDFRKVADVADDRVRVSAGACALYTKYCPDGVVRPGPNVAGARYFIIVEPGWWSLGEEAEDLIFYPPATLSPTDGDGDKVWTSGVPRYVDVRLKISDPDFVGDGSSPGARTFCERVAIPAGVQP